MRRWLLLLIVALLPLRAWVGEAMAAEMLARHQVPAAAATHHADAAECAGHHGEAAPAAQQYQGADGHEAICAACQACSTIALAFSQPPLPAAPYGAAPRVPQAVPFASAEPAPADKPPIS
jgi:hypothetical protein